jgi:hypothetical protein
MVCAFYGIETSHGSDNGAVPMAAICSGAGKSGCRNPRLIKLIARRRKHAATAFLVAGISNIMALVVICSQILKITPGKIR